MKAALLIGIDNYSVAPLAGCVADAQSLAVVLATHHDQSLNFHVKKLLSSDEIVTRSAVRENLHELFSGTFDAALFFFAGHGMVNETGGCIVTQDVVKYDEGISMSDILAMANRSRSREVVVILDCCHSGSFGAIPALESSHAHLREGLSVLCASRDSQTAAEVNGRGVFTGLIVEALYGGASDLLGRTTVADVFAFVDRHLGPWDQRPLFKCHVSQLLPLRQTNPRIDVSALRQLPTIFPTPDSRYELEPSYESDDEISDGHRAALYNTIRLYRAVGLVRPASQQHMYFAAMLGNACRLTQLGQYYWHLVESRRI